jgi:hypothetical protein
MNVQPWLMQVGWFWRVVVALVASVAGPSVIVPGGCEATADHDEATGNAAERAIASAS